MLNNEIRRLVRCIVEASAESNIQIEEIQAEIARQFGKEIQPQVHQDAESQEFIKKAKLFCKNEMGYEASAMLKSTIELLCVFHELRCKTQKEDMVSRKMLIEMFVERSGLKESTATERSRCIGHKLMMYLEAKKGIKMHSRTKIETVLEEVYPFVMQM